MDQETPTSNLTLLKEEEVKETSSDTPANESAEIDSVSPAPSDGNVEDDLNSEQSGSGRSDRSGDETDDASVVLEREEGDGQEEAPNRKVDDDEDKRNPQYIPKRGTFYEHDDRTAVEEAGEEVVNLEEERDKDKDAAAKKKVWSEKEASKWNHDRFNDTDQAPKSKTELISIYGYDIRNEEGPPRARRRRRYGRGPNKYTRNWEDEDAYGKPTNVVAKPTPRKTRGLTKEEFPPLGGVRNHSKSSECTDNSILDEDDHPESIDSSDKSIHQNEQQKQHQNEEVVQEEYKEPRQIRESAPSPNVSLRRPHVSQENGEHRGSPQQQQQRRENATNSNASLRRPQVSQENGEHRGPPQQQQRRETAPSSNAPLKRPQVSQENGENRGPPQQQQQRREIGRGGRLGPKRQDEPPRGPMNNSSRGITRSRGFRSGGGRGSDTSRNRNQKNPANQQDDEYSDYIVSQNFTNKSISQQQRDMQELDKDMSNMNMQDANYNINRGGGGDNRGISGDNRRGGLRQTSVPPRLQGEQRGSKRYSSLRQRSLPETAPPVFGQHSAYYPPEFSQQNPPAPNQQGLRPHPNPSILSQVPANNTQQMIPVASTNQTIGALPHQLPNANGAPPIIQGPPPQFAQSFPQAPSFLQPSVVQSAAFLPQQPPPPQLINYAATPAQFPQQPTYNNFPHQQFTPVPVNPAPQPGELYQPQGGITYYSTQNQQLVPRIPQKRRTAAIPIVPPPEHKEPRGRGRLNQGDDSPVGSIPEMTTEAYIEQDIMLSYHQQEQLGEASVIVQQ